MKNKLKVLLVSLLFTTTAAMAAESLIAIEGSYAALNVDKEITGVTTNKNVDLLGGGLKIGAQSEEFRIFLQGNYYQSSDSQYNYVATYGAEIDYLINTSKYFNVFLGLNGGIASIEQIDDTGTKRTSSDPYFGGAAGINIHASKTIDLEFGGRMLFMNISNTRDNITYTYNTLFSGYASIIFKFQMD